MTPRKGPRVRAARPPRTPQTKGFRLQGSCCPTPPPIIPLLSQCFLRFVSKNPPSNYLPSHAHGGTLPTNALEKKGTDGSFIAHLEMFPRLLCSSPIHSCRIPWICQLESPEAAAGGPGPPRAPARGRALAMARSPGREGGSAAGAPTARVRRASALTRALGPSLLLTRGVIRVPRHVRVPGSGNYRVRAALGDASTLDALRLPPSGFGKKQPGGGDYRAPRSFSVRTGNLGDGCGRRRGLPPRDSG